MKPLHLPESTPGQAAENSVAGSIVPQDCVKTAEHIGMTLVELSGQARAAGLTTLAFLLEAAALEAVAGHRIANNETGCNPEKSAPPRPRPGAST